MNITPGVYPDFSETTLEALTLAMGRRLLQRQKNLTINFTGKDVMDLTLNEEDSVVNLDIDELETYIEGGAIKVQEPFVDAFEPGIGSYPFNQTNLASALLHLVVHQHIAEFSFELNPEPAKQHCDFSIRPNVRGNGTYPLICTITLTDYPVIIDYTNGMTSTAQPYLLTP
ncbi:hypothetical protein [Limnospira platensis]|uniref:hypothetical protein n=2 Tax=Limnospira platensis TaxID=118562 RepID=UPI0001D0E38F|nr:hypothetical protein AP285_03780 [Arthrospira platensis YZ]KDR54366.1 hypothetical protein APPUASWS_030410 [Arthrospira platensis str. Paraca]MDF2210392.1 hypothetical protein [Arthrospira platensis NCB002]QQW27014.1 hypothetical protein AP9108_16780 [Arthrospira sp. PCC 9108]BAI88709.1 hypothetical protein NIES39_A08710 [Arthrospira platensis NIES-39]